MHSFYNYLHGKSNVTNIVAGIGFIFLVNFILFPYVPELITGTTFAIKNILDLRFSYSPQFVEQLFVELENTGRNTYLLSTLLLDFPYAIVYGFVYAIIIIKLFANAQNYAVKILFILPFGISFFDILENAGIVIMLLNFPEINSRLVLFSSVFTSFKWVMAIIVVCIIFIGVIRKLLFRFKIMA